jgi:ribosome biogenesis GTPase
MNELEDIFNNLHATKKEVSSKRILIKDENKIRLSSIHGRIVASYGKNYFVKIEDALIKNNYVECSIAGRISSPNKKSTIAVVGDIVKVELDNKTLLSENPQGKIVAIERRTSVFSRKPLYGSIEDVLAANVDKIIITTSAAEPVFNKRLIDRLLVSAEAGNIEPIICVNKIDLEDKEYLKDEFKVYEQLGIEVIFTSAIKGRGIESLKSVIHGSDSVLCGSSGVGKSSILNKLIGKNEMKVNIISDKTYKGKHTTSYVKMFEIDAETNIIDTPGIREFGIIGIDKAELALYFHDFDEFNEHCRFIPCTHTHEPGCAVKEAVENGTIDEERYISYLNIYDSM